jgi:hypothetical protein
VDSRFGSLLLWRRYGWCEHCQQWQFPADHALGLGRQAPAAPYLQEICALLVSKMPAAQAVLVADFQNNAHRMKYKEIIEARKACDDGTATQQQIQLANQPPGFGSCGIDLPPVPMPFQTHGPVLDDRRR